jgi:hypothetical protein
MSVNIGAPSNYTLQKLELLIQQQEELLGALVDLGNDGAQTVIVIDDDQLPPSKLISLKPTIGEATPHLSGYNLVCTGICFIVGQRQKIAAYRST